MVVLHQLAGSNFQSGSDVGVTLVQCTVFSNATGLDAFNPQSSTLSATRWLQQC